MRTQPDGGLVRRHDVWGLTELEPIYRAEYGNLVGSLTILAGSRDAAADAVQDAFVAAGQRWPEVASLDNPTAWIRVVAARKVLDGHRRAARWRRLVPLLGQDHTGVARDPAAGDDSLAVAVTRLPTRQRAAVVLHYLADWPIADVAAALEVAPGTVKSALSDARGTLRVVLGEGAQDV